MKSKFHNIGGLAIEIVATAAVVCLLCGLGGCAQIEPAHDVAASGTPAVVEASVPPPVSEVAALLYYAQTIRGLAGKEFSDELERVRQAYSTEKTDLYALQYALALSVPSASVANQRRALLVLEPLAASADGRNSELQALAALLRADIGERRRLEDIAYVQTQKLREEQRRAEELEKKAETLTKKLEALINIERNLLHRDKSHSQNQNQNLIPGAHK